jgi:very-short-patch-repair endonuclease
MGAQSFTESIDRLMRRTAARQHGTVARRQLLSAGATARQLETRLRSGRLTALHQGVYLVGAVPGAHTHEAAALLACGRGAALSHRSAAQLWGLLPYPATAPPWITIPPERNATRPRIKVCRAAIDPRDLRRRHGMPLTSPPRTILDMAALLGANSLEHLVAEASYRGLAGEEELHDQLQRNPGRRGLAALRSVLGLPGGPMRTRSGGERALLRLLRRHGIEGLEANARVAGYEVDLLWREEKIVIELDGWEGHSGRAAFERDRLKWARLGAAGFRVMPVTARQIRDEPEGVIRRLVASIHANRKRSPPVS